MSRPDPVRPLSPAGQSRRHWLRRGGGLALAAGGGALLTACGVPDDDEGGGGGGSYADRFTRLGSFTASGFATARTTAGAIVVLGGSRGESTLSAAVDRFDTGSMSFIRAATLATGRERHEAVRLADGRLLVAGGTRSLTTAPGLELVDPATWTVTGAGDMPHHRIDFCATRLADGRVLFTGGRTSGEGASGGISRSADLFDPATGNVTRLSATLAHGRASHCATLLADGRVLITGGFAPSDVTAYVEAEVFDPVALTFTTVSGGGASQRGLHAVVTGAAGEVWILGGESTGGVRADVLRYDARRDRLLAASPLAGGHSWAQAVLGRDGEIRLFGGFGPSTANTVQAAGQRWLDGRGGVAIAALPQARAWHRAEALADGRVLIIGGENSAGFTPDLLLYD